MLSRNFLRIQAIAAHLSPLSSQSSSLNFHTAASTQACAITPARICMFIENNYEDLEVHYPLIRLQEAGATVTIVGPQANTQYKGKYGYPCTSQKSIEQVSVQDFDALVIPGGCTLLT